MHYKFVEIHPFYDDKGLVARFLMHLILMRQGYPPVVVPVSERKKYYAALEKAGKGDYFSFVNLMVQFIEDSLNLYLSAIGKSKGELLPLSKLAPKIVYSFDYLSLLARRGEIFGRETRQNLVFKFRSN